MSFDPSIAEAVIWIGGILLFGIGTLLNGTEFVVQRAKTPEEIDAQRQGPLQHKNYTYYINADQTVEVETDQGWVRMPTFQDFDNFTAQHPKRQISN